MKKTLLILLFFIALDPFVSFIQAQPQFRNTTSFDTGDSIYFWSARIGSRLYQSYRDANGYWHGVLDDTTTGYHIMNTCPYNEDLVGDSIIRSIYVGASDDTVNVMSDSCRDYGRDSYPFRFTIYTDSTAGIDQFTVDTNVAGSGMQRIAPGYLTSIRLGCMQDSYSGVLVDSTGHYGTDLRFGAQSLFYTMRVTPENALLIINYAIVARRYDHSAFDAGEFLVRVVAHDSTGGWANEPINDSLWYKVSAPHSTGTLEGSPWKAGSMGEYWPCRYVYKPWSKCAVSLDRFIGQDVRVEFYTANCIYGVDPLYAYIAGDYASPILTTTGCPGGLSPFIDTLIAPEGMLGYQWYAASHGVQEDLLNPNHMDTVTFHSVTPLITTNVYCPTQHDFVIHSHDTIEEQTFMCVMYSALDPAKPITSKIYANIRNHKPVVRRETHDSCDRGIIFINRSTAAKGDTLDPTATYWIIYDDLYGVVPLDTLYGDSVRYVFAETRSYMVEQHVAIVADSDVVPCASSARVYHPVKGPTPATLHLSSHGICKGMPLVAQCHLDANGRSLLATGKLTIEWSINDSPLGEAGYSMELQGDTILTFFDLPEGVYVISLSLVNHYGCPFYVSDSVRCFLTPKIVVDPASGILCLGDTLTLTAYRDDMDEDSAWFEWSSLPDDPDLAPQQGLPSLRLSPEVDTRYTLHPSPLSHCQTSDISVDISVEPYPVPSISYAPVALDLDNPTLTVYDNTSGSAHTYWSFSDGAQSNGPRATHLFDTPSLDGVDVSMHTCNAAGCCSDTAVHIPLNTSSFWIPNAFSPSLDGANSRFCVVSNLELLDFEIYIYNRMGQLVFSSTDPHFQWDGTDRRGLPLPQASYVYLVGYRLATSESYRYSSYGTVTLLR